MASPCEIIRACLIDLGYVVDPGTIDVNIPNQVPRTYNQSYIGFLTRQRGGFVVIAPLPCFCFGKADDFDLAVFLRDTAGNFQGRMQRGERTDVTKPSKYLLHPGISMLVRHTDPAIGYTLANNLALGVDKIYNKSIVVNGTPYNIQSVYRTMPLLSLGEEVGKKRFQYSIDYRVAFKDSEPMLG